MCKYLVFSSFKRSFAYTYKAQLFFDIEITDKLTGSSALRYAREGFTVADQFFNSVKVNSKAIRKTADFTLGCVAVWDPNVGLVLIPHNWGPSKGFVLWLEYYRVSVGRKVDYLGEIDPEFSIILIRPYELCFVDRALAFRVEIFD